MSEQYDNTNRGAAFPNENKQEEWHADYRGTINVNGQEFYIDLVRKIGKKSGKPFIDIKVKDKNEVAKKGMNHVQKQMNQAQQQHYQQNVPQNVPQYAQPFDDFEQDSDLPF